MQTKFCRVIIPNKHMYRRVKMFHIRKTNKPRKIFFTKQYKFTFPEPEKNV